MVDLEPKPQVGRSVFENIRPERDATAHAAPEPPKAGIKLEVKCSCARNAEPPYYYPCESDKRDRGNSGCRAHPKSKTSGYSAEDRCQTCSLARPWQQRR